MNTVGVVEPGQAQIGCAHCSMVMKDWRETEMSPEVLAKKAEETQRAHSARCRLRHCVGSRRGRR